MVGHVATSNRGWMHRMTRAHFAHGLSGSHPVALAAHVLTALAIGYCVLVCPWVSTLAYAGNELPLTRHPAPHIFCQCHRFQVLRIYATPRAALVVKLQSFWDRPDKKQVSYDVGTRHTVTKPELPVSIWVHVPKPQPTSCVWLRGDVLHESRSRPLAGGKISTGHVTPFSRIALGLRARQRLRAFSIVADRWLAMLQRQTGGGCIA